MIRSGDLQLINRYLKNSLSTQTSQQTLQAYIAVCSRVNFSSRVCHGCYVKCCFLDMEEVKVEKDKSDSLDQ